MFLAINIKIYKKNYTKTYCRCLLMIRHNKIQLFNSLKCLSAFMIFTVYMLFKEVKMLNLISNKASSICLSVPPLVCNEIFYFFLNSYEVKV